MDRKFFLGIGLAIVIVFAASAVYGNIQKNSPESPDADRLYQVSTIDALMLGVFDGVQTIGDVKNHGDFGIGTFHGIDGEMIVLDGIVYHAKADGAVSLAQDYQTTPFATVTWFEEDFSKTTGASLNFSEFPSTMENELPTGNMVYAVKMHGTFPLMKVRAIPLQEKPYPTLADASTSQAVYTFENTTGTIIGFYTPVFFKGLNVPGYHLHYLSDDHTTGGHILDMVVPAGMTAEYDITQGFVMELPTTGDFTGLDLSGDLSEDLAKVEK